MIHTKYFGHPDQKLGHIIYSQRGEDLLILNLFQAMGVENPTYLDLGAHHPFIISNTALLYSRGSRGINVEANPDLMADFHLHRKEDVNLNYGAGLIEGQGQLLRYSTTSGRNTFCDSEVEAMKALNCGYRIKDTIVVPVKTINDIVNEYAKGIWPDLLSIDIEGLDLAVLQSAAFTSVNGPKIVVVETRPETEDAFKNTMAVKGYTSLCRIFENFFFIPDHLIHLVR